MSSKDVAEGGLGKQTSGPFIADRVVDCNEGIVDSKVHHCVHRHCHTVFCQYLQMTEHGHVMPITSTHQVSHSLLVG